MADALVSVVLEQLASIIDREIQQEVRMVVGVSKEIPKLTNTLQTIQLVLVDAEKRQVKEEAVKDWLEKLKDISYDMDDVLDEWSTAILKLETEGVENAPIPKKKVCFYIPSPCFCFGRVVRRHDIAVKIKELNERLDVIANEKDRYNFKSIINNAEPARQKTTSFVDVSEVYGRDQDKITIVSKLLCESCQEERGLHIISIVGMGGIGKTTLAQLAYNDDKVEAHFEKRIWVCVSDPLDEIRIAKAIVETLEDNAPIVFELETLLRHIQKSILGKKFLLVLDDVWTGDNEKWEPLIRALKYGSQGSRILVTTRNEKVAKAMRATYMLPLGKLTEEECWLLFNQRSFFGKGMEEQEKLKAIGRKIANKCKGLPLAAKTLGSLMWFKKTEQEWRNVLDSEIWELEEAEKGIFPPLLLSYYDLPAAIKRCFSYCAIFPKDYVIETDKLIQLWMAQGYLSSRRGIEMETIGREYFENLVMRSFFQDFGKDDDNGNITSCKMHDIVHDFAQFLTKNECFIMKVDGGKELSMDSSYRKGRHSTVILVAETSFPISIYNIENLHTLFFMNNAHTKIVNALPNLFHHLKCLRALDLRKGYYFTGELPREVGNLIHLRYLNLSSNSFKELPETVCDLCNLQTLDLSFCKVLEKLPKGMGKLISLRHLEIDFTDSLSFMSKGIGRLSSLQTLTKFIVSGGDEREACKLGDLKNLNNLRGRLTVRGLGNVANAGEAEKAELKSKKHLLALDLNFSVIGGVEGAEEKMYDVIEAIQPHPNLEFLAMSCYRDPLFPNWMTLLPNLRKLELNEFHNCVCLPPLGKLPSLESLEITRMDSVKKVGVEFLGIGNEDNDGTSSKDVAFPKLGQLTFQWMREWEEWDVMVTRRKKEQEIRIMPCLRSLKILSCPKLKAPPHHLQTTPLEDLVIDYTGTLFPNWLMSLTKLRKIQLSGCHNCVRLPPLGKLPSLESLFIAHMSSLKKVGAEFLGIGIDGDDGTTSKDDRTEAYVITAFPKLTKLIFQGMEEWEEWDVMITRRRKEKEITIMPFLCFLSIHSCPKLKALPHHLQTTPLEELIIHSCPILKQRCQKGIGEDWFKISHIPHKYFL